MQSRALTQIPDALAEGLRGSYRLTEEIGRGGMATVYRAHDLKHDRPVALKVVHAALGESLGRQRFEREIRFAARLQHPHVLSVIDSGETDGRFWFTMPFVRGESLRDRLRRDGPLPLDDAIGIIRQAAQALAYAHREGVVHRDIKPENILITEDGATLVADFGVARALETDAGDLGLTQPGAAVGTPLYMAPEQAMGDDGQDGRVDQYALGAVAFELLVGAPPFTGRTAAALIDARLSQPTPSVRTRRPDVPPLVDEAIQQALAVRPSERFPTLTEFARALAPGMSSSGVVPIVAPTRGRRARRTGVLLGLLVLVAGYGVVEWRRASPPLVESAPAPSVPRIAVLPFENLGDSADAYFADGLSDAIRGTLASVPGIEVIARGSSMPYRAGERTPRQIADELGVRYLLSAVVRWERRADGASIVHLTPELVEVPANGAAMSRWQQQIDQPITNVFEVQAEIAGKVTAAMQVALGGGAREQLARAATAEPAAYDAYLRAEAQLANASNDPVAIRASIQLYEDALALDSTFVAAWSKLSIAQGLLYYNSTPRPELARAARASAERAVTLAPQSVAAHSAMADYYRFVALDPAAAARELDMVRRVAPTNVAMLAAAAANARSLGRNAEAVRDYSAALALSPRTPGPSLGLAITQLWMRNHDAARAASDHALALAPTDMQSRQVRAMVALGEGRLEEARAIVAARSGGVTADLAVYLATYWDTGWMLDAAAQQLVLTAGPDAHDGDRALQGFVNAQLAHWRGDEPGTRRWAAQAEREFSVQLREVPTDGQRHVLRGLMLAYLGRGREALAEADRGIALEPPSRDAVSAAYYQHLLARIHVLLGQPDAAMDVLERLLATPYFLSAAWLRIDPTWTPLHRSPRFRALAGLRS